MARAYLAQLQAAHVFSRPIATRIDPAGPFYPAEAYHQDYLMRHPDAAYIAMYDIPKVHNLQTMFPQNWQDHAGYGYQTCIGKLTRAIRAAERIAQATVWTQVRVAVWCGDPNGRCPMLRRHCEGSKAIPGPRAERAGIASLRSHDSRPAGNEASGAER